MNSNYSLTTYTNQHQANVITSYCIQRGQSPLQVLFTACGGTQEEPYYFDLTDIVEPSPRTSTDDPNPQPPVRRLRIGEQKNVYLKILSQLLRWNPELLSAALLEVRGQKRLYFSKSASQVRESGRNIDVHHIPGTEWYACTHLHHDQKAKILRDVMHRLGFSYPYSLTISALIYESSPRIPGLRFQIQPD